MNLLKACTLASKGVAEHLTFSGQVLAGTGLTALLVAVSALPDAKFHVDLNVVFYTKTGHHSLHRTEPWRLRTGPDAFLELQ